MIDQTIPSGRGGGIEAEPEEDNGKVEYAATTGHALTRKKPLPMPISQERIKELGDTFLSENREAHALYNILYLTAARVSEMVPSPPVTVPAVVYRGKQITPAKEILRPGLTRARVRKSEQEQAFIFKIKCSKNKGTPFRQIPVSYSKEFPLDRAMLRTFTEYVNDCVPENRPNIFTINRNVAKHIFRKIVTPMEVLYNPSSPARRFDGVEQKWRMHAHFLRTCRLTHLVEKYNFSTAKLMIYAGWTNTNPTSTYVKLNWRSLHEQMTKNVLVEPDGGETVV